MNKGGRPTKLTPAMLGKLYTFCCEVALVAACRLAEVDRVTVWRWTKQREGVRRVIDKARQIAKEKSRREREWNRDIAGQFCNVQKPQRRLTRNIKQPPRKYRPEMARMVQHSLRATARALGVHWITVHRWTRRYRNFGGAQGLARLERRFERLMALPGVRELVREHGRD